MDDLKIKLPQGDKVRQDMEALKRRKRDLAAFLPGIIMFLLIIAMSSISTLLQFELSLADVAIETVLSMMVLRVGTMLASKWIGGDLRYKKEANGDAIQRAREEFVKLARAVDPVALCAWLEDKNKRDKITAIKLKADARLFRARAKVEQLRGAQLKHRSWLRAIALGKATERLDTATRHASLEYIESNVTSIKIRFRPLRADDFISWSVRPTKVQSYTVNPGAENTMAVLRGLPSMVFMTMISAMLTFSVTTGDVSIAALLSDLFFIAANFSMGYSGTGAATAAKVESVYIRRAVILRMHLDERKTQG